MLFRSPWTIGAGSRSLGTFFVEHPNHDAYQAIMQVARATVDPEKRAKLYKAYQILSTLDVPWIPLWSMTDEMVTARWPYVKGLYLDVSMDVRIYKIYKE